MLFSSIDFIIFLLIVLSVYWSLKSTRHQNYFLLISSLFFYGYADWKFLFLIITCALVGYFSAIAVERYQSVRKPFLVAGIIVPFGILFVFKYFNFFIDSIDSMMRLIGLPFQKSSLSLMLPLGISFFTFQTVGYVIDVYNKKHRAENDFWKVLLFVSFFPQLVAGPIERASHLLPQIKNKRTLNQDDIFYGLYLIIQGFVKKIVIADNLAPIVDSLFKHSNLSGPLVIVALVAFAFQIYGDFSGYTDIARGTARLMGFKILLNFNHPYISLSPTEFWHSWHITLSNWFRDYVYIPLGGNRRGHMRTCLNLMITWSLCGLWHGASLNFILWGGFHGIALIVHKLYAEATRGAGFKENKMYGYFAGAITFMVITYGWIFFRIADTSQIWTYTRSIFTDWTALDIAFLTFSQIAQYVFMMIAIDYFEARFLRIAESRIVLRWTLSPYIAGLLIVLAIFISDTAGDFIYFRF